MLTLKTAGRAWGNTAPAGAPLWGPGARAPRGGACTFPELAGCAQLSSARAAQLCCSRAGGGPLTAMLALWVQAAPSPCKPFSRCTGDDAAEDSGGRGGHSRKTNSSKGRELTEGDMGVGC